MSTASKWIVTTAVLSLASLPALGATTVYHFGSNQYIHGSDPAPASYPADYNMKYGNQPFRDVDGSVKKSGSRAYTEAMPLTGPAAGLNVPETPIGVGGAPTNVDQTYSGYSGPEVYGGYGVRVSPTSTAVFTAPATTFGYQGTDALTSGSAPGGNNAQYFGMGMQNNINSQYDAGLEFDEFRIRAEMKTVTEITTPGTRVTEVALLTLGKLASPIEFDADSKIDFVVGATGASQSNRDITERRVDVRAVVKAGEVYYISNFFESHVNATGNNSLEGTFDFTELSTGTWSTYDPLTSLYAPTTVGSTLILEDITYAGVHLTHLTPQNLTTVGTKNNTYNSEIRFGSFTVTAAAIPEPASLALLVLGSALIGFRRQR